MDWRIFRKESKHTVLDVALGCRHIDHPPFMIVLYHERAWERNRRGVAVLDDREVLTSVFWLRIASQQFAYD